MDAQTAQDIHQEVSTAAALTARQWPGVIDADDAEQEMWVRILESDTACDKLEEMNSTARRNALAKVGSQIASEYRESYAVFSGQIFYSTNEVRSKLRDGLLATSFERMGVGTTLTEYVDATDGLNILRERHSGYASILIEKYFVGSDPDNPKKLQRAVDALTQCMNRARRKREFEYEDGPGTKDVLSNSIAQVIKSREYAGDFDGAGANYDFGKDIA